MELLGNEFPNGPFRKVSQSGMFNEDVTFFSERDLLQLPLTKKQKTLKVRRDLDR